MTGFMRKSFTHAAAAAMTALSMGATSVLAADTVTTDQNGYAQCEGGDEKASAGEMPTVLANQFWLHLGCGKWDEAFSILGDAPKSPIDFLPNPTRPEATDINSCYFNSFAYGPEYHAVSQNLIEGRPQKVNHGFYGFTLNQFEEIQGAMLAACKAELK